MRGGKPLVISHDSVASTEYWIMKDEDKKGFFELHNSVHKDQKFGVTEPEGLDKPGSGIVIKGDSKDKAAIWMFKKASQGGYYMINLKYSCRLYNKDDGNTV